MSIIWQTLDQALNIHANEVHLVAANLSCEQNAIDRYWNSLSDSEKARANRFYFPEHRCHFIAARGILRELLAGVLAQSPDKIEFHYQSLGKPELLNQALQFNVSHSGPQALFAFTLGHSIGVDIEKIKACDELELAARFFAKEEYQALLALAPLHRRQSFFQIWSQKEAFIKALGQGLSYLDKFSVSANGPGQLLSCKLNEAIADWYLQVFDYHDEFKAAFASKQSVKKVHYWLYKYC
ncbi:MAG: sfp [Gammaproteobacteria bacterium]|jgi:4'-phosphopantetheinyl transferase|nr:sfp [Gammaproteobacteria bacterium]